MKASTLLLVLIPTMALAQSTRPASTRPAATQPVRNLARYFGLVKNEFMKTESGEIVLVPDELRTAIDRMRDEAADEKESIDDQIEQLSGGISGAEAERRKNERAARDAAKLARANERRSVVYRYSQQSSTALPNVQSTRVDRRTNAVAADLARSARADQEQKKQAAQTHKDSIAGTRVELVELKKRSSALAWAVSASNRNLPPRAAWKALPQDTQDQLKRVGITLDEFKSKVLPACKISETTFLDEAVRIDKDTKTADELADGIGDYLIDAFPKTPRQSPKPNVAK